MGVSMCKTSGNVIKHPIKKTISTQTNKENKDKEVKKVRMENKETQTLKQESGNTMFSNIESKSQMIQTSENNEFRAKSIVSSRNLHTKMKKGNSKSSLLKPKFPFINHEIKEEEESVSRCSSPTPRLLGSMVDISKFEESHKDWVPLSSIKKTIQKKNFMEFDTNSNSNSHLFSKSVPFIPRPSSLTLAKMNQKQEEKYQESLNHLKEGHILRFRSVGTDLINQKVRLRLMGGNDETLKNSHKRGVSIQELIHKKKIVD